MAARVPLVKLRGAMPARDWSSRCCRQAGGGQRQMREHVCRLFLRLVTCSGPEIVVANGLEERRRHGGQGERQRVGEQRGEDGERGKEIADAKR